MDWIKVLQDEGRRTDLPAFRPGDTVRVHFLVSEGGRDRLQPFEGLVVSRQGSGASETFTVRRVASGVGVEKIFPLHSPRIEKIEILRRGEVRRAKLYYIRTAKGKKARIKERKG